MAYYKLVNILYRIGLMKLITKEAAATATYRINKLNYSSTWPSTLSPIDIMYWQTRVCTSNRSNLIDRVGYQMKYSYDSIAVFNFYCFECSSMFLSEDQYKLLFKVWTIR